MRTHPALHVLNGLVWIDHKAHVTGASMTPGEGRLDFELSAMSREFGKTATRRVNEYVQQIFQFASSSCLEVKPIWILR